MKLKDNVWYSNFLFSNEEEGTHKILDYEDVRKAVLRFEEIAKSDDIEDIKHLMLIFREIFGDMN